MIKKVIRPINYAHIDISYKKGYWSKIRMEFLRPILAKTALICEQPAMLQWGGVQGGKPASFGVLERMMTSSNGDIFRVTGPCAGNLPVTGEFPAQRPVTRSFDIFFDLRLNKRLSKQSWGWWFDMPSRSLCRHCNGMAERSCDIPAKLTYYNKQYLTSDIHI